MTVEALSPKDLTVALKLPDLDFETTDDLAPGGKGFAQARAQPRLTRRVLDSVGQARHLASSFTVQQDADEVAQALADAENLLMACPRIWPGPFKAGAMARPEAS